MHRIWPALVVLVGCSDTSESTLSGPSQKGQSEDDVPPQHCWDLNSNGTPDASEDTNGDGTVDVLDCRGADGASGRDCWDLDGDGLADPGEDRNGDGVVDVGDCSGEGPVSSDTGEGRDDSGEPTEDTGEGAMEEESLEPFLGDLVISELSVAEYFCTQHDRVYGDLTVSGWTEPGLDALSCLVEVTGVLRIRMADERSLVHMELPNLERVGGALELPEVTVDTATVSFPALRETGSFFLDGRSDCTLTTVNLPMLETVTGTFSLYDTFSVTTVHASRLLQTGSFQLHNVDALTNLSGFGALQTIDGGLSILYNRDLNDLTGMASLTTIADNVQIVFNAGISDADANAFISGVTVGGSIDIRDNTGP